MLGDEKISPDGRWVSFVRDYNIWIVSTSGGDARPVTTGGSEALRKGQLDLGVSRGIGDTFGILVGA